MRLSFAFISLLVASVVNASTTDPNLLFNKPFGHSGANLTNSKGTPVKLTCTSWVAHQETWLPEGLSLASLTTITSLLPKMNLNCVRFTVSIDSVKNPNGVTGRQMAKNTGLAASTIAAIDNFNPGLLDQTITTLYGTIFDALSNVGIMVIIDNHVSKATWCCSTTDGNGWPGLNYFVISDWVNGLSYIASTYGNKANVIGISMRNEPRGSSDSKALQNAHFQGATAIYNSNPNLLIIVSGINYDSDLTYEMSNPIGNLFPSNIAAAIQQRIMYEGHHYSWFANSPANMNKDDTCALQMSDRQKYMYGVRSIGYPFYISEFGFDTGSFNPSDPWFTCLMADLLKQGISASIWQLSPQYYIKTGTYNSAEGWALATMDYSAAKNPAVIDRLGLLKNFNKTGTGNFAIVHAASARCLLIDPNTYSVYLGPCTSSVTTWKIVQNTVLKIVYDAYGWKVDPNNGTLIHNSGSCVDAKGIIQSNVNCGTVVKPLMNGMKLSFVNNGVTSCPTSAGVNANDLEYGVSTTVCDPNDVQQWFFII